MARKKAEAAVETVEAVEVAESKGRPDVANTPRQSAVAFADYVLTLNAHAPEILSELVAPETIDAALAAIDEAGENFHSTLDARVAKVISEKVAQAQKALTNEDPLNGYAAFAFDPAVFAEKTRPKVGRKRLSPAEKAEKQLAAATPEEIEALTALLAARGL